MEIIIHTHLGCSCMALLLHEGVWHILLITSKWFLEVSECRIDIRCIGIVMIISLFFTNPKVLHILRPQLQNQAIENSDDHIHNRMKTGTLHSYAIFIPDCSAPCFYPAKMILYAMEILQCLKMKENIAPAVQEMEGAKDQIWPSDPYQVDSCPLAEIQYGRDHPGNVVNDDDQDYVPNSLKGFDVHALKKISLDLVDLDSAEAFSSQESGPE